MRIVDQKGKLFGKINLLDFILLLIFTVLLLGGIYKLTMVDNTVYMPDYQQGEITIRLSNLRSYEVEALQQGDLIAVPKIQDLGKVISVTSENRVDTVNSADGKIYSAANPMYFVAEVTLQSDELVCRDGKYFVGKNYKLIPGQALDVTNGVLECKGTLLSIEIK